MNLKQLREALAASQSAFSDLAKACMVEGASDEQRASRDVAELAFDKAAKELEVAEKLEAADVKAAAFKAKEDADKLALAEGSGRRSAGRTGHVAEGFEADPAKGYASHADFLTDVKQLAVTRQPSDRMKHLAAAGSDGQNTYNEAKGGILIPEAFVMGMKSSEGFEADATAALTTKIPMAVRCVKLPYVVDKDHSSSVSGGLRVYRRAESDSVPSSTLNLGKMKLEADDLMGVTYATNELLSESMVSFVALLNQSFGKEFNSKIMAEKISGTGVGQYQGVLNAASTITVAKSGGQSADTITGANILAMRSRCWNYGNAIWITNHDCFSQIVGAHVALTNTDAAVFVPGNGTDVPDTLYGRPIMFSEHASTLGNLGDIILGDWSQYYEGTFAPVQGASSIHVRFLEGEETFKFWTSNAGASAWETALTPKNSSTTLSPIVTLAARA